MLPDKDREELWEEISLYFASDDSRLKVAALELQDVGYSNEGVRIFLAPIWSAGYEAGWDSADPGDDW
jgi:hypothetical protein